MMLCGYRGLGRQEQAAIELNSVQLENFFGVRLKWRQHRLGLGHGEHYQASIQHLFERHWDVHGCAEQASVSDQGAASGCWVITLLVPLSRMIMDSHVLISTTPQAVNYRPFFIC